VAATVDVVVDDKDWKKACCDRHYEVKFGKGSSKGSGKGNDESYKTDFEGDVSYGFTLSHSSATGNLTFTIGGLEPLVIELDQNTGWENIGLYVEAKGDDKDGRQILIENLVLNEGRSDKYVLENDALLGSTVKGDEKKQGIILTDDAGNPFHDFVLSGDLVFSWNGKEPKEGDLKFLIGVSDLVSDVVPIPAAAWLFGSALGLLGMTRRRMS